MNENGRWFSSTNYEPACKQLGTIGNSLPDRFQQDQGVACVLNLWNSPPDPGSFMEFSTPDMSSFNWEGWMVVNLLLTSGSPGAKEFPKLQNSSTRAGQCWTHVSIPGKSHEFLVTSITNHSNHIICFTIVTSPWNSPSFLGSESRTLRADLRCAGCRALSAFFPRRPWWWKSGASSAWPGASTACRGGHRGAVKSYW